MKERIKLFVVNYLLFLLLFIIEKPIFMSYYAHLFKGCVWGDWFRVMFHGLPLDLSLSGYLSVIPGLVLVASAWTDRKWLTKFLSFYYALISFLIVLIFIVDINLYGYWGFRLDATPLFYIMSSPKDALASAGTGMLVAGTFAWIIVSIAFYLLFYLLIIRRWKLLLKIPYNRINTSLILFLLTAILFIPIRGGFSVATMNVGQAYFSSNQRLNHAAINPLFSLMETLSKSNDFAQQYRFMEPAKATALFSKMIDPEVLNRYDTLSTAYDSLHQEFATNRPDIYIVIMESFSSKLMKSLTALPGENVAVNLDSLSRESLFFTNFYANSFRTDRGVVSVLSGYPAQPTSSIMKYPRKSQTLPSIARSLKKQGYDTRYYYGGDANFTNMRSYVLSTGFDKLVSDVDFPLSERTGKWGVHDHFVFRKLMEQMKQEEKDSDVSKQPILTVLQTSSSHEPFKVPYHRLKDERLNAFAYADSCVGDFVRRFKQLPQWKNSVLILVPDHLGAYPKDIDNLSVERYQIPLLILGGAVRHPREVKVYGSQQDIAATLLAQLGLKHGDFTFSKDLFNPLSPHFAFFTFPDAFGLVTPQNQLIYNCQSAQIVVNEGEDKGANLLPGQAYLQKLYDDLSKR